MARSLTGSVKYNLTANYTNTLTDGDTLTFSPSDAISFTITSGTTSNKADRYWKSESRTLTSGNSETFDMYDLASLALGSGAAGDDILGQTYAVAEVASITVYNHSTSAGNLVFGNDGTTAAWQHICASDTAALTLPPNTCMSISSGNDPAIPVADTSNHLLKIAAASGDITYSIWVYARSA